MHRPGLETAMGGKLAQCGQAIIDDPNVEVVALACSPHKKADWAEAAAAAGKHIFLNKPFAGSLDSARRIGTAVEAAGVQLCIWGDVSMWVPEVKQSTGEPP